VEKTNMSDGIPQLRTPGVIAAELSEPIGRVLYVIRKLGIKPIGRAGTLRLFDRNAVELVRGEITRSVANRKAASHA
jgi:hypothetical protein